MALTGALDTPSRDVADAALARSLVTFAIARTLDSAISVVQGTEVAVEPGGVGVNFAPGQALDPINDLVERFSAAMLVATSSLALQGVLLDMARWWAANLALVLAAALALVAIWRPSWLGPARHTRRRSRALDRRVRALRRARVRARLELGVPDVSRGGSASRKRRADGRGHARSKRLRKRAKAREAPASEQSLTERLEGFIDDSLQALDARERMRRLAESVSGAVEHMIHLIVIFALQSIILPLVFLWLFAEALKKIAARATHL